ncbi:MAG: hypothetical protein OEV00_08870 [Acidobacteriota bacterium]|nr:hypothetical protein [Acidobacteriota bacterium]
MRGEPSRGLGLVELLAVLAMLGVVAMVAFPGLGRLKRSAEIAAASRELATTLESLRWISTTERRYVGLWFDHADARWSWWRVADGNGNGLRVREIADGSDLTVSGPHDWRRNGNRTLIGLPPMRVRRIPPGRGWMPVPRDPIRFGQSDLVSFAPDGSSSSGTVFLTDGRQEVAAVVLYGGTGRVRVWRWNLRKEVWTR